jgi:hypothetical protein
MDYTTSQLACFKACPKKWYYRFKLMLDPIGHKRTLELGSYVHHLLDVFYNPDNTEQPPCTVTFLQETAESRYAGMLEASEKYYSKKTTDLFEDECTKYDELRSEAEAIVTRYIERNADDLSKYWILATEKEFSIPIYTPAGKRTRDNLMGKFDMIVLDEFETVWFFEHKTTADSVDNRFETVELEEQLNNYILVASHKYADFGGGILNVIRKKAPRMPVPLKKGGLSRAKDIDTTYELYMEAIEKYGYNPADYTDILSILKEKGNRFFGRKIVSRKPHQILETRNELYYTIQSIKNMTKLFNKTKDAAVFYRTPTYMCKNCQYCNLCILNSKKSGDMADFIAGNFIIRETLNPELSIETVDGITK